MNTLKVQINNRTKIIVASVLLPCLFFACNRTDTGGDGLRDCSERKYVFPDTSSDGWKSLAGHQEMAGACQIPQKTLAGMCTDALGGTCLDYPLLYPTVFAFSNVNDGLRQLAEEFNGFSELVGRKDVASVMLQMYNKYDPVYMNEIETCSQEAAHMTNILFVEIILAYEPVMGRLTEEELPGLIALGLGKVASKRYSEALAESSRFYLLAKTLEMAGYAPLLDAAEGMPSFQKFLGGHLFSYEPEHAAFIEMHAKEYLAK